MPTEPDYRERRRGERVLIRIPIKVYALGPDNTHINESAEAVVVSRFGALLRMATPPKLGTQLEILNSFSQEVEKFRIVWLSEKAKEGKYEVGVEFLQAREDFWGIRFPAREQKS